MEILDLANRLKSVDFMKVFDRSLEKVFPNIVELIKDQLEEGTTGNGNLPRYYFDSYAKWKRDWVSTYSIYPNTDLRVTGNLYEGIFVQNALMAIEIESRDPKSKRLEAKYGQRIYVLNQENMEKLKPILFNALMTEARNAIGI